jgi:hypothetical protein
MIEIFQNTMTKITSCFCDKNSSAHYPRKKNREKPRWIAVIETAVSGGFLVPRKSDRLFGIFKPHKTAVILDRDK